ncbi:MAG: UDP-glucose/GDP-mannose dehydrogenase family protein [Peptococcaceae bacterium]|nr:UDP-glucose/GDP-mannose dehydrogenase family protein [Peptococcaceae bacterium]
MARLCVIGLGYVGLVTASCFARLGHRVAGVDKDLKKVELLSEGIPTFFEPGLEELIQDGLRKNLLLFTDNISNAISRSDIIFICVGTPPDENGQADLSQLEEVSRAIARNLNGYKLIVEKSTVPAGTAEKIKQTIKLANGNKCSFDVASNPEFLREGSAVADFLRPDRVVLGVESSRAEKMLRELYREFSCPVLTTDIATAELIKHASNAFLAMKISYINLVADICEKVGADVNLVADGMGYDRRIGREFLNAGAGYGGSCFPKDVKAFASMASDLGVDVTLLKEVDRINERRIFSIIKKLEEALWVCKNKRIAVLGLAFKPNTDDVRESPGIKLAQALVGKGGKVTCYDPKAMDNARHELNGLGDLLTFAENPYDAAKKADALVFMTEWPEFKKLDFHKIRQLMRTPVIIDGRNFFKPEMLKPGFWYCGIGRNGIKPEAAEAAQ